MKKKSSIYLEWLGFSFINLLLLLLPRSWGKKLGRGIGRLIYHLDARHREIALSNLQRAFGAEKTEDEKQKIAQRCFENFGEMIADFLKYSSLSPSKRKALIKVQGLEYFHQAQSRKKGIIIVSAHYGQWEVASFFLSHLGKLNVVARPLDNPLLEKKLTQMRTSLGAKILYKHEAARPILRRLTSNEIVVLLIDQNVLQDAAVFVDFFGFPAATTPAAAVLSIRSQAPILPAFCLPQKNGQYLVEFKAPIFPSQDQGEREEQILQITQRCTKIIESQIRIAPEFWMWFHNRWKTRPSRSND